MTPPSLLNLYKPKGPTSREAVNRVQQVLAERKVGHAGTLDPLAEGVLVLCIGSATRLTSYVQRQAKCYEAEFWLGHASPTDDLEGEVREDRSAVRPEAAHIRAALPRFLGLQQQVPPAYSAVKIAGRRAYEWARKKEAPPLAARSIEIHGLELLSWEYPRLRLRIECGSGTYVRSLGRDLAAWLGTTAVMASLVRTAIGPFAAADACRWGDLTVAELPRHLLDPAWAVRDLATIRLDALQQEAVLHGRELRYEQDLFPTTVPNATAGEQEYAAYDQQGGLVSILARSATGLCPKINLRHAGSF